MKKNDALSNDDVDADAYNAPTQLSTAASPEMEKLLAESSRTDDPPVEATKLMANAPGKVPALYSASDAAADHQGATVLYPTSSPDVNAATASAAPAATATKSRFPFGPPAPPAEAPARASFFDGPWLLAFIVFCATLFVAGLIFYLAGS